MNEKRTLWTFQTHSGGREDTVGQGRTGHTFKENPSRPDLFGTKRFVSDIESRPGHVSVAPCRRGWEPLLRPLSSRYDPRPPWKVVVESAVDENRPGVKGVGI